MSESRANEVITPVNNYELTERGKIILAIILVFVLFVIPAAVIFAITSCT